MWRAAWEEFIPFPACDVQIRRVLFSTNAIESLHARYRRAVTVRGRLPTEQAAVKCLYLVTRGTGPKGTGQARWTMRWKPAEQDNEVLRRAAAYLSQAYLRLGQSPNDLPAGP